MSYTPSLAQRPIVSEIRMAQPAVTRSLTPLGCQDRKHLEAYEYWLCETYVGNADSTAVAQCLAMPNALETQGATV